MKFLILIISIEHIMLIFKIFIEYMIPEVPTFVKEGELDRELIANQLYK